MINLGLDFGPQRETRATFCFLGGMGTLLAESLNLG